MATCSDSRRSGCGVRTRGSASWRRGGVAAWRRSGESPAAFARRTGIAVHRLYYRITTTGPRRAVTDGGPVQFHPVRVLPERLDAGSTAPIEIRMIRVPRGVAPEELRAVLAALDSHG